MKCAAGHDYLVVVTYQLAVNYEEFDLLSGPLLVRTQIDNESSRFNYSYTASLLLFPAISSTLEVRGAPGVLQEITTAQ